MTNRYHAQPYNIDAEGFFFETYEEYLTKSYDLADSFGQPVEEFILQFIDGDKLAAYLFRTLEISSGPTLKTWFEEIESLKSHDLLAACYLADDGYALEDILDTHLDDTCLFEGSALDYAHDHIDSMGTLDDLPKSLRYYFDYEAFARDLVLGGDITEWTSPNNTHYVVTLP